MYLILSRSAGRVHRDEVRAQYVYFGVLINTKRLRNFVDACPVDGIRQRGERKPQDMHLYRVPRYLRTPNVNLQYISILDEVFLSSLDRKTVWIGERDPLVLRLAPQ